MLDKKITYKGIVMKIDADAIARLNREPKLPQGFSFRFYQDGDAKYLAEICQSVQAFDTIDNALAFFARDYLPHKELLKQRCIFIVNSEGIPVATSTTWFAMSVLGYQPTLHWVATRPEYQGLGLGNAVVEKATALFGETDPGKAIYLHTQTWSHTAIRIYHKLGYYMAKTEEVALMCNTQTGTWIPSNDYSDAIEILKDIYDEKLYSEIVSRAK